MANLLDPPAGGLDKNTNVSFHYGRRVLLLVAGAGAFAAVVALLGNRGGDDPLPHAVWVALLLIAVVLSAVVLLAPSPDPDADPDADADAAEDHQTAAKPRERIAGMASPQLSVGLLPSGEHLLGPTLKAT